MKRLFLLFTCLPYLLCAVESYAQAYPQWLIFLPPKTETYYYRIAQATALTEDAALKKAFARAIYESALAIGVAMDLSKLENISEDSTIVAVSKFVNIPINKVCTHVEALVVRRGYKAYVLCQVANDVRVKPEYNTFNCFLSKEEKAKKEKQ